MYLYYVKENDKHEPPDLIVFDSYIEAQGSLREWNKPNAKLFECIDITDLALKQEDKSKLDVQTFIHYGSLGLKNPEKFGDITYARWVMNQYDVPATLSFDIEKYRKEFPLYCTYQGKRYKYVGHSRLGDVWITSDFKSTNYELRVSVLDLENFSKEP